MHSLPRTLRALLPCALVAAAVALPATPAQAADSSALPIPCIQTGVLPAIGNCPQQPAPAPTPTPTPEPAPAKPTKKPKVKKGQCANTGLRPDSANGTEIRAAILCLLNKERTKRGRKKLRSQSTLQGVAERYAAQMVQEGFFDHVSPAGTTMIARIKGTSYLAGPALARWSVGENLAWGTGKLATPSRIMKAWMKSPGHRENILDRAYREVGIGMVLGVPTDASKGATYVTEFGQRIRR